MLRFSLVQNPYSGLELCFTKIKVMEMLNIFTQDLLCVSYCCTEILHWFSLLRYVDIVLYKWRCELRLKYCNAQIFFFLKPSCCESAAVFWLVVLLKSLSGRSFSIETYVPTFVLYKCFNVQSCSMLTWWLQGQNCNPTLSVVHRRA